MDSLAAYRNTLGLPAVSLELDVITAVGYPADNPDLAAKMPKQRSHGTDLQTLSTLDELLYPSQRDRVNRKL